MTFPTDRTLWFPQYQRQWWEWPVTFSLCYEDRDNTTISRFYECHAVKFRKIVFWNQEFQDWDSFYKAPGRFNWAQNCCSMEYRLYCISVITVTDFFHKFSSLTHHVFAVSLSLGHVWHKMAQLLLCRVS